MDQVDDPVRQIGREVGTIVRTAIFAQTSRDVDARPALAERELYIRVGLVIAQQDVESRLALLDQIIFEGQRLFVVCNHDVINVDGLAYQGSGLGIFPPSFVEITGHAAAQVLRLAHINDVALGVLVEIDAGFHRNGADFGLQVHAERSILLDGKYGHCGTKRLMTPSCVVRMFFPQRLLAAIFFLHFLLGIGSSSAWAQSITQLPANQSNQPQLTKSPQGKQDEAARAAARAPAHHFDRVLIIVLENVDYEVASKDKNLADLAAQGASFTNFHALFHPSYPNYLAMVAGTDFGIHRRGRLLADNQVNIPNDAEHRSIADRLIAAGLDFKQYAEELPNETCPWNYSTQHVSDKRGNYARRHVPLLSFREVQQKWCDRVIRVDSSKSDNFFVQDAKKGLVAYSIYTPNMKNDGHDSNVQVASAG